MHNTRPGFILTCSVASLISAAAVSSVHAQAASANNFTGLTSNDWNDPTNWSANVVPNGTDAVVNIGTAVYGADTGNTPVDIYVGASGNTARLDVTAGTLTTGTTNWSFVGVTNGTGTLNIADTTAKGGTFTGFGLGSGSFAVGNNSAGNGRWFIGGDQNASDTSGGTGTVNINTTGTVTVGNDFYLAANGTSSNATLNMDAGTLTQTGGWTFVGGDRAGDGGAAGTGGAHGTINQSGGTITMAGDTYLGRGNGSTGTLNMTGGSFTGGNLFLATNGSATGTVTMANGTLNMNGNLVLGNGGTGVGTLTQNGGTVTAGGELQIGNTVAANAYTLNAGSVTVNSWVAVGRFGGTGELDLNGGTFTKTDSGNGFFDVAAGTTSTSTGTVNLNTGATLVVPKIIQEAATTGTGTFNFNGGILQANADGTRTVNGDTNTSFMQGVTTANVRNGGAVFDTAGYNINVAQALTHSNIGSDNAVDGGLSKRGAGVLTLTGASNYTGATTVSVGTLAVNGSIGGGILTVATGATLAGTGTATLGANAVSIIGTLAPGATPNVGDIGTLTVNTTGVITLATTATFQFDIASVGSKDLLSATGATLNLNGTLALSGTIDPTATYTIASGLAAENGTFAQVTGTPTGYNPTFTFANGNYNLSFAAVPEPSTWAMGIFGLGLTALWLRRRRVA